MLEVAVYKSSTERLFYEILQNFQEKEIICYGNMLSFSDKV